MEFDIEKFARLARIKLTPKESKKLSKDLEGILGHFEELQEIDTSKVSPMTGGTLLKNVFREDKEEKKRISGGVKNFPESKEGYLKVPKVFK